MGKLSHLFAVLGRGALRARNRLWVVDTIGGEGGEMAKGVWICIRAYLFGGESFEEKDCHGAKP